MQASPFEKSENVLSDWQYAWIMNNKMKRREQIIVDFAAEARVLYS